MHIALVNKFVHLTGGADRHCLGLAELLRDRGHDVAFLSTASADNAEHSGVFVEASVTHRTREELPLRARCGAAMKALWNVSAADAMRCLISDFRPDVIHSHKLYPQLSVAPVVVATRAGIPVVQTLHDFELVSASALDVRGGWIDFDESRVSYRALNSANFPIRRLIHVPRIGAFVSVSRFLARVAASHGIDSAVLPNFVPGGGGRVPAFGERRGIVFVGRLRPEKGVLDVVEMARRLPSVPVQVVGDGVLDGTIRERSQRLENLELTGFLPKTDVGAIIRSARIVVVPSRCHEAAGLVSLEAMSQGTPTVVYASGGLAEYVSDAGSGVVVPVDVESLTLASAKLHDDEAAWQRMSKNGLAAVAGEHSPERYGERIERVYERVLRLSPASQG